MMKSIFERYGIPLVAALTISLSGVSPAHANLIGSDNFNDNIVDTSKWGSDYVSGGGALTEINSRLEYTVATVPSSPGWSSADRPWILNHGSYVESWTVRLDVGIGNISVSPSGGTYPNYAGMGLYVENSGDSGDGALVELAVFSDIGRNFLANSFLNKSFDGPSVYTGTISEAAAVQIAFNSLNKLLFLQYDINGPVGGYDWITLRTVDITAWNMTDATVFNVSVSAGSGGLVLTSGDVWADNFDASPVPEPATMFLLGTGLLGLVGLRSKFRQ